MRKNRPFCLYVVIDQSTSLLSLLSVERGAVSFSLPQSTCDSSHPWLPCFILGYLASSLVYSLTETFTSSVPCHFCAIPGGTGIFAKATYGPTCPGNAQPLLFQVRLFSVGMAPKGTRHVWPEKQSNSYLTPPFSHLNSAIFFSNKC